MKNKKEIITISIISIIVVLIVGIIINNIPTKIELKYKYVGADIDGISMISDGEKYGYYDIKQKKEIVPLKYKMPFKLENGDKKTLNSKYGMIPITGKDPIGDTIYGIGDIEGKTLIKPRYSSVIIIDKNTILAKGEKYLFIDKKGNLISKNTYQDLVEIKNSNLLISYDENEYGIVNTSAKELLKNEYKEIDYYVTDSNVLFKAKGENVEYYLYDKKTTNFTNLQIKEDFEIINFNENIIVYRKDKKCYIYNINTNNSKELGNYLTVGKYSNGLAFFVDKNNKVGFIDNNGNEIIKAKYDNQMENTFIDSVAAVSKNHKALIIDKNDKTLLESDYEILTVVNSNRIIATKNHEDYLIDINNKKLTKEKYELIQKLDNNYLISYTKKGKKIYCGLIDYDGNVIEKSEYLEIEISDNYYFLKTDDGRYIIKKLKSIKKCHILI